MQCPRCQQDSPTTHKFCRECGTPLQRLEASAQPTASYADLQQEVTHLARALNEALEQQAATSEILRIISSSLLDLQPVMDTVAERAARLCEASDAQIFRLDGDAFHLAASHGPLPPARLVPVTRGSVAGRAMIDRQTIHIRDFSTEPISEFPDSLARGSGVRTVLAAPLLREGVPIGVIVIRRMEVRPFSDKQVALLQTFADQAVIALENVRLFTELEARNRDLTATSEILKVISSSPTDVQPVLDTVVEHAGRLCSARDAQIFRREGERLRLVAHHGPIPSGPVGEFTMPISRATVNGRSMVEQRPVQVADLTAESVEFPDGQAIALKFGHRTVLSVPLMQDGVAIGTLAVRRAEVRPFTDAQVGLLRTFADQAVIAIENVRLFTELQNTNHALTAAHAQVTEALEQQTATSEILSVISSSPTDVEPVFQTILNSTNRLCEASFSVLWLWDGEALVPAAHANVSPELAERLRTSRARPRRGGSPVALTALEQAITHVPDVLDDPRFSPADVPSYQMEGARSILAVPMLREGSLVGVINTWRREPRAFTDKQVELLKTFADQAVIAIENVRLFRELEAANRELGAASRHKSEFLANMSHELRTPLNAIIGFSEVLAEKMFGEVNAKQAEYLQDILESGRHLLSLINDILDLSKIEAGRMELEAADFDLPSAIDNALILVRERATRRGITLGRSIDEHLGIIRGDERKVRQVLLNLLSNALKFTPEGGRIDVRAALNGGRAEVSVTDTGVGIAAKDQAAVFEEFRQVGTADKKVEGTGLGLALSQKFVQLHGGRLWVESELGRGSTFTFALPVG